eukprot:scaffold15880_cov90-Isochrysis_galbana.AAC.1
MLPHVRALAWTRKAKYRSLGVYFQMRPGGALPLIDAWPALVPEILASLASPDHAAPATELLAEIAISLKQAEAAQAEIAISPKQAELAISERAEGAISPSHAEIALSELACRSFWTSRLLSPMVGALACAGSAHADRVLQAVLPAAVEADPRCLGWAMALAAGGGSTDGSGAGDGNDTPLGGARLGCRADSETAAAAAIPASLVASPPSLRPEASVRLLIALFRTGRRLGLLSAEQVHAMDRQASAPAGGGGDWSGHVSRDASEDMFRDASRDASGARRRTVCRLPVCGSVLASAVLSDDDGLMMDALDVLCISRQLTEPPTLADLRLIRACLEVRLKGAPTEARKGIVHRLRRFLVRCRAATFASAQLRRDLSRLQNLGEAPEPPAGSINRPSAGGGGALPRTCAECDPRVLGHPARMDAGKGAARLAMAAERREVAAHVARFLRW